MRCVDPGGGGCSGVTENLRKETRARAKGRGPPALVVVGRFYYGTKRDRNSIGVDPNDSELAKLLLTASSASRVRYLPPGTLLPALGDTPCELP